MNKTFEKTIKFVKKHKKAILATGTIVSVSAIGCYINHSHGSSEIYEASLDDVEDISSGSTEAFLATKEGYQLINGIWDKIETEVEAADGVDDMQIILYMNNNDIIAINKDSYEIL